MPGIDAFADPRRRPRLAWRAGRAVFDLIIPQRHWLMPSLPGIAELEARSRDGLRITGWCVRGTGQRGTILVLHGLLRNCTMDGIPAWAERWLGLGFATAAVDLRGHGRSDDAVVGAGLPESWDTRAALDILEARGFPRPFLLVGGSLGALAAQRAAYDDSRVVAAALLAMPGSPWRACRAGAIAIASLARSEAARELHPALATLLGPLFIMLGKQHQRIARLICAAYGGDVLTAGDAARFGPPPHHRPRLLSVIGDLDLFGWQTTLAAWKVFPGYRGAEPFRSPSERPYQDRWFLLGPQLHHPPIEPHVLEWPRLPALLDEFVTLSADDAARASRKSS
jgi:pimeloyl-ACP methyl ester carboxylesterase